MDKINYYLEIIVVQWWIICTHFNLHICTDKQQSLLQIESKPSIIQQKVWKTQFVDQSMRVHVVHSATTAVEWSGDELLLHIRCNRTKMPQNPLQRVVAHDRWTMAAKQIPFSQCTPNRTFANILRWYAMGSCHHLLCIYTVQTKTLTISICSIIINVDCVLTLSITLTSVNRSMQQIFRSYATRSRAGFVELMRIYFCCSERITGLLRFRSPNTLSIEPKTFFSEPDDVPIGKPRSSSCCNVWMSWKWMTVVSALFREL